jgi:hypothetical protein
MTATCSQALPDLRQPMIFQIALIHRGMLPETAQEMAG